MQVSLELGGVATRKIFVQGALDDEGEEEEVFKVYPSKTRAKRETLVARSTIGAKARICFARQVAASSRSFVNLGSRWRGRSL